MQSIDPRSITQQDYEDRVGCEEPEARRACCYQLAVTSSSMLKDGDEEGPRHEVMIMCMGTILW